MNKILSVLKQFAETAFIYTYFIVGIVFALIVCAVLFFVPKKHKDNFTPDGYDL